MPNDTQMFEATPKLVDNNVQWTLCHMNPPDPPIPNCGESNGNYPDVILGANKGHYDFEFKIVNDNTGLVIKFATTDPIAIKKGEPADPGKKQIHIGPYDPNVLKFKDKNDLPDKHHPDPVVLDYQLNFTDHTNKAVTSIDPDITNGGTNKYSFYDYLVPIGGALLAGIILAILFRKLVLRRAW